MMRRRFAPSGLVVALLGFVLTRSTVTFALSGTTLAFVVGNLAPLVLGLSLSAFGVALAVGTFEQWYVRTIAGWTALGTGTIGLLVVATVYGSARHLLGEARVIGIFSNVLVGGSVGGALTGVYAAQSRSYERKLLNRQNRLVLLNRLLHDRVMNAVTVIKGSVPLLREQVRAGAGAEGAEAEGAPDSVGAIVEKMEAIEETMSSVQDLAEPESRAALKAVDVSTLVEEVLGRARKRHPDATFVAEGVPPGVSAYANRRLADALYQLAVNGAEHARQEAPRVALKVEAGGETVTLSVIDEGPGLPERERQVLEQGATIAGSEGPTAGLGLYLARLSVQAVRGTIETDVSERGTAVSITVGAAAVGTARRDEGAGTAPQTTTSKPRVGVAPERLAAVALVALGAGAIMGGYVQLTVGAMPIIGALYGAENVVVGALTHEFHSLVFGLVYAAILGAVPPSYGDGWSGRVGMGVAWGGALWLVASGIIMPVWLNLVGMPAPLPDLGLHSLGAHLLWGGVLGAGDHASREWDLPRRIRSGWNRLMQWGQAGAPAPKWGSAFTAS